MSLRALFTKNESRMSVKRICTVHEYNLTLALMNQVLRFYINNGESVPIHNIPNIQYGSCATDKMLQTKNFKWI